MTNNDVLKKIRYTFDYSDSQMIEVFEKGDLTVDRAQVSNWLKKEDAEDYKNIYDKQLAHFLNGFIVTRRGKKDDTKIVAEQSLNNNIILRKMKIALNLKVEGIISYLNEAGIQASKSEITAFFRKPEQSQYRLCKDQFLRNFLMGMQLKLRKN